MPLDVGDFAHANFSLFHGILKEGTLYKFGTKCICKCNQLSGGGRLFQIEDRSSVLFSCVQAQRLVLSNAKPLKTRNIVKFPTFTILWNFVVNATVDFEIKVGKGAWPNTCRTTRRCAVIYRYSWTERYDWSLSLNMMVFSRDYKNSQQISVYNIKIYWKSNKYL